VSQLNTDILVKIQHCFQDLQPQVKLKLLLSFFHIPRRNLEQWRRELENILAVAKDDSEPWVCMLAELMKTFPESGQLCSEVNVPDTNRKIFNDLLTDLKKALKKSSVLLSEGSRKEHYVLPLECHYLNKNAFMSVVGHQPQAIKHFTLRRKPKAAALRAELLNKSSEAGNKMKPNASAFPTRKSTMPSKMGHGGPIIMKGGDPRDPRDPRARTAHVGGFNRNARMALNPNKKEGGVKLLDITEQPIGMAAMKKRKRQQELDDAKKFAEDNAKTEANKADPNSANNPANINSANNPNKSKETPDYAVGLSTLNPPTPAPNPPAYAPPTPAYAPPTPAMPERVANVAPPSSASIISIAPPTQTSTVLIQPQSQQQQSLLQHHHTPQSQQTSQQPQLPTTPLPLTSTTPSLPTQPLPQVSTQTFIKTEPQTTATRLSTIPLGLNQLQPLPQSTLLAQQAQQQPQAPSVATIVARLPTQPQPRAQLTQATARIVQLPTQPIPQNRVAQMTQAVRAPVSVLQPGARIIRTIQTPANIGGAPRQILTTYQTPQPQPVAAVPAPPANTVPAPPAGAVGGQPGQPVGQQQPQQPQQPGQVRKHLTLTKEQMFEAQEMFRTANKVTRPEKALILGFMAGSRENPCPHLGNVVTIKLSENQESVLQNDGTYLTMIVEIHFQMNYSSGEWKRIKKYRRLED